MVRTIGYFYGIGVLEKYIDHYDIFFPYEDSILNINNLTNHYVKNFNIMINI